MSAGQHRRKYRRRKNTQTGAAEAVGFSCSFDSWSRQSISVNAWAKENTRNGFISAAIGAAAGAVSQAQTYTPLADFTGPNGASPSPGPLVQGLDGKLYGCAYSGGDTNNGTVFRINPSGNLTSIYSGPDREAAFREMSHPHFPKAPLALARPCRQSVARVGGTGKKDKELIAVKNAAASRGEVTSPIIFSDGSIRPSASKQ